MPSSSLKVELARVLKDEGYITSYAVLKDGSFDKLVVELKYTDGRRRVISQIKRISKPGRRMYAKKDNLPKVLGGLGTAVISTSSGLMTAREAQRLGVGGEVVCFVW
jgi:small subunit ribosomal protein S8